MFRAHSLDSHWVSASNLHWLEKLWASLIGCALQQFKSPSSSIFKGGISSLEWCFLCHWPVGLPRAHVCPHQPCRAFLKLRHSRLCHPLYKAIGVFMTSCCITWSLISEAAGDHVIIPRFFTETVNGLGYGKSTGNLGLLHSIMAGASLDLFLEPHLEDWDLHRFMWRESMNIPRPLYKTFNYISGRYRA